METKQISFHFYLGLWVTTLIFTSCSKEDATFDELTSTASKTKIESVEDQLKRVKQMAMRFHSFEQAAKAGYAEPFPFNPSPYVPNMGFHYSNVSLMDGVFELEKPEILLYVPNEHGKLKLVGVEYAVPAPEDSMPPEGFIGDDDHWHYNPNVAGGSWTLHAWVVMDNPDGVFAAFNPNVPVENPAEN
ncbi:hypothetical protein [Flagellimonas sp.]|uniref:hypothetical protein n=1 Tax=Flagellimonas sp. TaxID=2058762 RepID=UPI003B5CE0F7